MDRGTIPTMGRAHLYLNQRAATTLAGAIACLHRDPAAAVAALRHPDLPADLLVTAAATATPSLRAAAARHPAMAGDPLQRLLDSDRPTGGVAANPNLTADQIITAAGRHQSLHHHLAARRDLPSAALDHLQAAAAQRTDGRAMVATRLLDNPTVPHDRAHQIVSRMPTDLPAGTQFRLLRAWASRPGLPLPDAAAVGHTMDEAGQRRLAFAMLAHPDTDTDTLIAAATRADTDTVRGRQAVAAIMSRSHVPLPLQRIMFGYAAASLVGRPDLDRDLLHRLLDDDALRDFAANLHLLEDTVLHRLAADGHREAVAGSLHLPDDLRDQFAADPDPKVRGRYARRHDLTWAHRRTLMADPVPQVAGAATTSR